MDTALLDQLKQIVGPRGFLEGEEIGERSYRDLMGARRIRPPLLLRPASTPEVAAILRACHAAGQAVAVQGGMTGLVSAAAPREDELALSLERMKQVIEIDPVSATMTVEAGVALQVVQETAAGHDLLYPLDLGARGSCTIGGNLATNAGGNRVIRYGMTRDLVLGLEAVLADGTVVSSLNKLRKNNTGYDLKQLFIGSEGTLGVITRAVLKLVPRPRTQQVAFCGIADFRAVSALLQHGRIGLGAGLTAFEVIWHNTYELICQHVATVRPPLAQQHGFYVLIESMGQDPEADGEKFEQVLASALDEGLVEDAVLASSTGDCEALWQVRDAAAGVAPGVGYMHNYDVSMALGQMDYFGSEVERRLRASWPDAVIGIFGHAGDGNLHVIVHAGPETRRLHQAIDAIIYGLVGELDGSVSAEHGIGLMKKDFLAHSRSPEEIGLMRILKNALDPRGILNPGRILDRTENE